MRVILMAAVVAAAAMPTALTAQETKPDDSDRKICHNETPTGSYFAKRVCHTKAEWQALAEAEHHNVDAMRQAGLGQPGAGPR